jgi:hypothetical protein
VKEQVCHNLKLEAGSCARVGGQGKVELIEDPDIEKEVVIEAAIMVFDTDSGSN